MKNTLPKVSIVIAFYNMDKYIDECLESVFSQVYENNEVILVNDGSEKESRAYLKKYESKIHIIDFVFNKGVSAARNAGINHATGEYIAFLDSDDIWDPGKLSVQINYLLENKNVDGCHTGINCFNNEGVFVSFVDKPITLTKETVLRVSHAMPSAFVIKRSALLDVGLFDVNNRNSDDHDIVIRLVMNNYRIDFIPKALTNMRREGHGNLSSNFIRLVKSHFYLVSKFKHYFFEYYPRVPLRVHYAYFLLHDSKNSSRYVRPLVRVLAKMMSLGYRIS